MTSRRKFVQLSAAACTLGVLRGHAASLHTSAPSETFVFPEWLAAMDSFVERSGSAADRAFWQNVSSTCHGWRSPGRGLLSLPAPGVELFGVDEASKLTSIGNDRLAHAVRASGGRLAGLATICAADPEGAHQAEHGIGRLGLSGLTLGVNHGLRLDSPSVEPVLAYAAQARVPVYLPASYAPVAGDAPYRARGDAGIMAGAAAESASHAAQLIFGGVLDRHPGLQIILGRLGEATPAWYGRLRDTQASLIAAGRKLPRLAVEEYFRSAIRLTTADIATPETMRWCQNTVGRHGLLSASMLV